MNILTLRQQLPAVLRRNNVILPKLLCYILVVLIALSSARLVWSLISKSPMNPVPAASHNAVPRLMAPPPPSPDYGAQIARLHLMGEASVVPPAAVETEPAPDTSLNITLSGILALGNGKGFAIIEDQSRKNTLYQVDEEITSGVTLYSVYADYVLLNRSGRNEKLSLPKSKPVLASADFSTETAPADSSDLAGLRQQLIADPSAFTQYITINAAQDEAGKFIGYQVKPASPSSSVFNQLGLVENDIILSINDIPLDNPNKAAQALQNLINAPKLEIAVMRAGTEINLLHNLE